MTEQKELHLFFFVLGLLAGLGIAFGCLHLGLV